MLIIPAQQATTRPLPAYLDRTGDAGCPGAAGTCAGESFLGSAWASWTIRRGARWRIVRSRPASHRLVPGPW